MTLSCLIWVTSFVLAPLPFDNTPQPRFSTILATLGKNHTSKEVRALGRSLKENPMIEYSLWGWSEDGEDEDRLFYLIWRAKGISVNIEDGKVVLVSLYNDCPEGYRRYRGELPTKLTFDDDVETVEKKLGKPEEVTELLPREVKGSTKMWEEVWLDYPSKGLEIILRRPVGGTWTINTIKATCPQKPAK
jgi:hypothetical protein